nr:MULTISPECIES: GerAB/ArcD/ProY family transporter [Paenibacillus]
MSTVKSFGVWPMIMMMTLSVGIVNHVTIMPLLLDAAGRDAWLSTILAMPFVILWAVFPLFHILKSIDGQPIKVWLEARGFAALRWIILVLIIGMLLFVSLHSIVDAVEFSNATYIPLTPSIIVTLLFTGLCAYGAITGLRTIAFVACILLPFTSYSVIWLCRPTSRIKIIGFCFRLESMGCIRLSTGHCIHSAH